MTQSAGPVVQSLRVPFLGRKPQINGLPKASVDELPGTPLALFDPPEPEQHSSTQLRVAYGADFLYLQAQFPADRLVARDRGYQFGDGLIVVVAELSPGDSPSPHYYLLGFSHQERPEFRWASRILWEHDRRTHLAVLDRDAEVAASAIHGVGRLEVAIPWATLHPYHPWLSDGIGLNVYFVKARGEHETDVHGLLLDEVREQGSRRSIRMAFDEPSLEAGEQAAVVADGRIRCGQRLRACVAILASQPVERKISARIRTAEGELAASDSLTLHASSGLTRHDWNVATDALPADGFCIEWRSPQIGLEQDQGLTILPDVDGAELVERACAVGCVLPALDAATLAFEAEDVRARLASLAPARTAGGERLALNRLLGDCRQVEEGGNPVASRRGMFRRAFRSRIDGTLQPFSVLIPKEYSGAPWPLCVTFHGSGVDDVHHMRSLGRELPDRVLVVSPFGRGASNCFAKDEAQQDIVEAVEAMCSAYSVDRDRVFLMGFSMGAYGALRTYYENPSLYRAVAVFCTPPAIPSWLPEFGGETYPDFTKLEFVRAFAGTPMFVFHGRKDNSTPFVHAERMVEALRRAGARVTFVAENETGHEMPTSKTIQTYLEWVDQVVRT